jgi:uncharacterized membrane protein YfcA
MVVVVVAAFTHGTMGFGFPLISTPMIAMATDIRTAILATLVPNLAVNLISIFRGGHWTASVARHWPVAVFVLIGAVIGTRMLILGDPEPLKLLLSAMIVVFLLQGRLRGIDGWSWLPRHPSASGVAFGLLGGFLSGTVNVAVPPLVIYFMALGLDALAMTQVLNLCFIVGRLTQAATLHAAGQLGSAAVVATTPLTVVSLAALWIGLRVQRRIRPAAFQRILRLALWIMAAILAGQAALHFAR